MASTLVDLVKINISSTGTGPLKLGSAVAGYRGTEALTNGRDYSYSIQQGANWEIGRGTYLSSTKQLVRSVLYSSNGGTAIKLSQGAEIAFTVLSEDLDPVQIGADVQAAAAQVAADADQVAADRALVQSSSDFVGSALGTVAYGMAVYPNAYATALPQGATSLSTIGIGTGTGGTPGTYAGGVAGGPTGFAWTYTIGSDGKIASYTITNTGLSSTGSGPTLSYPTGGITGATVPIAGMAVLIPNQQRYWAVSTDGTQLLLYGNNGGAVASAPFGTTQLAIYAKAGVDAAVGTIGTTISTGTSSTAGGFTISGSATVLDGTPMAQAGVLNNLRQYFTGAGWAIPWVGKLNVDGVTIDLVTLGNATAVAANAEAVFPDFTPDVTTSHYVGFITDRSIVSYNNSVAGKNVWQVGTGGQVPGTAVTKTVLAGQRLAISYDVTNGTRGAAIKSATSDTLSDFAASETAVTFGLYPATDGTAGYGGGYTVIRRDPATRDGFVTAASAYLSGVGTGYVGIYSRNNDGTLKLERQTGTLTFTAGANTISSLTLPIKAGQFVGFKSSSGVRHAAGGVGNYYYLGDIGAATTASLDGTNTARIGFQITGKLTGEIARAQATEAALQSQFDGALYTEGASGDGTATTGSGNLCVFTEQPISYNGAMAEVTVWAASASTGKLVLASKNGSNQYTHIASLDVTLAAGANTFTTFTPKDSAGLFLGVWTNAANLRITSPGGIGARYTTGVPGVNTASTLLSGTLLAVRWKIQTGVTPRLRAVEAASNPVGTGFGLLTSADKTGATDATTVFASARQGHPAPYVEPGTYAVASLANYADGFWSAPRGTDVRVNGVHYPLPTSPAQGSLLLRARSAYSGLHGLGLPLVLIGDSLSDAGHTPGSRDKHWFSMHTAWLNNEFAPGGEPVLEILNDAPTISLTKAYFGITVSGGTALDSGPVGSAVILAAGDYIEFTGAYGEVDVFYNQKAGAGSLAWTYNAGAAYKTLSCAGATSLDLYSGPSATGQAASGTYRITASGGPVEVTGLVRDGIQVSTAYAGKKLKAMRPAIGGASCATFNNTRLTSIETQVAGYAAGQTAAEYIVGLHTNDLLNASSPRATNYEAGMNRIIDHLQASGAGRINWLIPPHFRSDVGTTPEAGDSFEKFTAIAERVCRQQGVYLFRGDYIDAAGLGLMADAVHPGAALNMLMADEYSRWRVATA